MHNFCMLFVTIGSGRRESPRWLNFGSIDTDKKELTIKSTQNSGLGFTISVPYRFVEVEEFWEQFREYRTKFLQENYKTIETV